jgi:hypothetical protein
MKLLFTVLVVVCLVGCKLGTPDQRDRLPSKWVEPDFNKGGWSYQRIYIEPSNSADIVSAILTDSTYEISDSSGVVAERVKGVWKIYDCTKALEVFFKLDSTLQKLSNDEWNKEHNAPPKINLHSINFKTK